MRRDVYHIDLGQNAVFYNSAIQIALIQYSGQNDRSTSGLLAKPLKKFPKSPIRPAGFHFCSARCGQVFNRLRAVSLFSVVRRAKRETRKWPRA